MLDVTMNELDDAESPAEKAMRLRDELGNMEKEIQSLRTQISDLEHTIPAIKDELIRAEAACSHPCPNTPPEAASAGSQQDVYPLSSDEYTRYGRQMIVPEVGLEGPLGTPMLGVWS